MKLFVVACLLAAAICQSGLKFSDLTQNSKQAVWNPSRVSPNPSPPRPSPTNDFFPSPAPPRPAPGGDSDGFFLDDQNGTLVASGDKA
jgi:hypothetical protein